MRRTFLVSLAADPSTAAAPATLDTKINGGDVASSADGRAVAHSNDSRAGAEGVYTLALP